MPSNNPPPRIGEMRHAGLTTPFPDAGTRNAELPRPDINLTQTKKHLPARFENRRNRLGYNQVSGRPAPMNVRGQMP